MVGNNLFDKINMSVHITCYASAWQRKNILTLQTGFCGMEEFKNVTSNKLDI